MHSTLSRARICFVVSVLGLIALGCSETANPVQPSVVSDAGTAAATAAPVPQYRGAFPAVSEHVNLAQGSAAQLSPADLTSRGWTCFAPPVPNRIVCSRPNQGFPIVGDPPAADRPATFTFLVFNGTGGFVGTELLLRTDIYNGQLCESTGEPYVFVPVIGYYECVHTAGR